MFESLGLLVVKARKVPICFDQTFIHLLDLWHLPVSVHFACLDAVNHIVFGFPGFDDSHGNVIDFIFELLLLVELVVFALVVVEALPLTFIERVQSVVLICQRTHVVVVLGYFVIIGHPSNPRRRIQISINR